MMTAASPQASPSSIVLSVRNVKKSIRGKPIIKGISFDVREGEIFGFLGPNGSGKTTTIRMLVDLIRPTEGTISICGCDVQRRPDEALQYVGCIVENPELYSYLTGWENLEHFARMLPNVDAARIQEVVDIVGMDQRIRDKVRTYSLGMRQRLGIAQALLGRPKLLILDEPTNGLDPHGIKEMREFIRKLADGGLSLFISSHLLSEIQQMCDRVAIISHGQVITVGDTEELVRQLGGLAVWRAAPAAQAAEIIAAAGIEVLDVSSVQSEPGGAGGLTAEYAASAPVGAVTVKMEPQQAPELTRMLVAAGIAVYGIEMKNPTLEDLFLSLTAGERIE